MMVSLSPFCSLAPPPRLNQRVPPHHAHQQQQYSPHRRNNNVIHHSPPGVDNNFDSDDDDDDDDDDEERVELRDDFHLDHRRYPKTMDARHLRKRDREQHHHQPPPTAPSHHYPGQGVGFSTHSLGRRRQLPEVPSKSLPRPEVISQSLPRPNKKFVREQSDSRSRERREVHTQQRHGATETVVTTMMSTATLTQQKRSHSHGDEIEVSEH
jgi:hypothetical protein